MPVSARSFALFTQQDIGQFRKGLELYHKLCFSGNKIRWKLRLVGFSYDKKSANVVIGKKRPVWAHLKRVKYIWTIRNLPFFACDVSAENTWYMCIILVANIVWRSDHAIRLSYLPNFSFSIIVADVSSQFSTSQRCNMIVLAACLMRTLFGR